MKKEWPRYNISRPRSRHGQQHREYKKSQYDNAYMY